MPKQKETPLKRRKRKRKSGLGYLFLFTFVFILALFGLSYFVKSFSPDVDVAIGNSEALTLNESDMEIEIKTVDERLKWIKMEDELPTVAIRVPKEKIYKKNSDISSNDIGTEKKELRKKDKEQQSKNETKEPPRPTVSDFKKHKLDFRLRSNTDISETPLPETKKISKVYLGNFYTIEDAMNTQHKVAKEESDIIPFIKSYNGYYVVQVGSFSDSDKANSLSNKMNSKGYSSMVVTEK